MINTHETFMDRCLHLALLGVGNVAPNPLVGSVLVYENRIIGEGYHKIFGGPHAEVNCINNVAESDNIYISQSTLYVSLEPCSHTGKTPPCSSFIIEHNIPRVVIGCKDLFAEVNGNGIAALKSAGINVSVNVLQNECTDINKRFFTFHKHKRPFVILKWAQTCNGLIAGIGDDRLMISNELTNRMVHHWRSEESAIMVGSNTVMKDNPQLNNRLWSGKQPIRLVLDGKVNISFNYHVLDGSQPTVIFNYHQHMKKNNLVYHKLNKLSNVINQVLNYAYEQNIQSILVEGGAALINQFIENNCWDEARVITNKDLYLSQGLAAPVLTNAELTHTENILSSDIISYYRPAK